MSETTIDYFLTLAGLCTTVFLFWVFIQLLIWVGHKKASNDKKIKEIFEDIIKICKRKE